MGLTHLIPPSWQRCFRRVSARSLRYHEVKQISPEHARTLLARIYTTSKSAIASDCL